MDRAVIVVEPGGIVTLRRPPPPPPTPEQQFQAILAGHRANLAVAQATIAQTTAILSSLPDRSDTRQRERDDRNDRTIVQEMQRQMGDSWQFGWWLVQHEATRSARDEYRSAAAALDSAARAYEKVARKFLANPQKYKSAVGSLHVDLEKAQQKAEAARKKFNAQIFKEQEAARDGYVDCSEDAAEWCVEGGGDKCQMLQCEDENDCVCTLSYRGGGEWDPKKQKELREKARRGAGKNGKDGDKAGGGGKGGHLQAPGPQAAPQAQYAEGSRESPEVPKKPASTEPPPKRKPPEVKPEGTTAQGASACRICADALALVASLGEATSKAGLEQQIECLWTAAHSTISAGGGRLTDGLDKNASDRKELVTELALRCSSQVSKRPAAGNAGRSATPGVRPGDDVRAPAASSVPDTGTVYQQAPTTSSELADLLTNDEIRSLLADCDDFFAAMSDARLTWRARLLVALAFVDTVIILEQKAGRNASGLKDMRQGIAEVVIAPHGMERWKLHDVFYWALKYCNDPKMIGHATGGAVGDPTSQAVEGPYAEGGSGIRREPGTGTKTKVTIRECNKILELSRNGKHHEALRLAKYWHIVDSHLERTDHKGRISGNGAPKYLKPYVGDYPHLALPRIVARWCYGNSSIAEAVRRMRASAGRGQYHLPEPPPRPPTTGEKVAKILLEEAAWTLLTWGAAAALRLIRLGRIARRLERAAAVARAGQPAEVLFTAALEARRIRTLSRSDDLVAWFRAAMGGEKAQSYAEAFDLSKKAAAVVRLRPGDVIVQWGDPKKTGRWFALLDHNPKELAIILEGREFRAFVVTRDTEALAGVAATQKPGKIPGVGGPGGENQIVVPDSAAVRALSGVDAGR